MIEKRRRYRLAEALLEMADDQHRIGLMDDATYNGIRAWQLGKSGVGKARRRKASAAVTDKPTDCSNK